jgi:hypothetical protein
MKKKGFWCTLAQQGRNPSDDDAEIVMLDYDETNDNFTSQTGSLGAKRTYASSP